MIEVTSNISIVVNDLKEKVQQLNDNPDAILRTVALAVLPEMKKRVHVDGKDSTGAQIGTYSPGYMAVRTGNFKNAGKVSRGANKGKLKDAGKFTKGVNTKIFGTVVEESSKVGLNRPKYNRSSDPKIIWSLTRQMENDMSVIATPTGYGIGYLNPENFKKATWLEQRSGKKVLTRLTEGEEELVVTTVENFLPDYLKTI